jgi:hypothetical protein
LISLESATVVESMRFPLPTYQDTITGKRHKQVYTYACLENPNPQECW